MKAWCFRRYGGLETLEFEELPTPAPGPGQLLVRVAAASVNPIDAKLRAGRLRALVKPQFPRVPGRDCSGWVVAAGEGITGFSPGELVAGVADLRDDGTHAEFARLPADQAVSVPAGISAIQAAACAVTGLSAYIPLVEDAHVRTGQRVLVHAGAGGVGGLAIQIARHLGAEVVATCGGRNAEYVRALGALRAIDYTAEDFVKAAGICDVVLDTLGGDVHRRSMDVLSAGGTLVYLNAEPVADAPPRADIRCVKASIRYDRNVLERVFALVTGGALIPQIGAIYALAEARAAYALSETGHARGKIILHCALAPTSSG